ncbi:MAG TPA: AHH domain-containing protein, partial [Caulobacteraceae bacterium]|nr:AHH domain-containing protein [Caulobacteraceae bacterium]
AETWGARLDLTRLAYKGGWRVDAPSNLIALPADDVTQSEFAESLPQHKGPHPLYTAATEDLLTRFFKELGHEPTPLEARAVFERVASLNRDKIIAGAYNPVMKVGR